MTTLPTTLIQFPEIKLPTSAAHQLRGFFGNLFKEKSTLLHNHYEDGTVMHRYPLVQYKVVDAVPTLVGINEGAQLLVELFLSIKHLSIAGTDYPVLHKNIATKNEILAVVPDELYDYHFKTLWMALNQKAYPEYMALKDEKDKKKFLDKVLVNNLLSFCKGVGYRVEHQIMAKAKLIEKTTNFKDNQMLGFSGSFVCNVDMPAFVGVGKSVARGFGTIQK